MVSTSEPSQSAGRGTSDEEPQRDEGDPRMDEVTVRQLSDAETLNDKECGTSYGTEEIEPVVTCDNHGSRKPIEFSSSE